MFYFPSFESFVRTYCLNIERSGQSGLVWICTSFLYNLRRLQAPFHLFFQTFKSQYRVYDREGRIGELPSLQDPSASPCIPQGLCKHTDCRMNAVWAPGLELD